MEKRPLDRERALFHFYYPDLLQGYPHRGLRGIQWAFVNPSAYPMGGGVSSGGGGGPNL